MKGQCLSEFAQKNFSDTYHRVSDGKRTNLIKPAYCWLLSGDLPYLRAQPNAALDTVRKNGNITPVHLGWQLGNGIKQKNRGGAIRMTCFAKPVWAITVTITPSASLLKTNAYYCVASESIAFTASIAPSASLATRSRQKITWRRLCGFR